MNDIVKKAMPTRQNWHVAIWIWPAVLCLPLLFARPAYAETVSENVCDLAAQRAAVTSGVPADVLKAITRTETGRKHKGKFGPWPWTVNMEGKGVWFETDDAARAYVYKHFKRGARSFDVGCFQINYRWHHEEFASIEEMFNPTLGASYAAKFLNKLRKELGSWDAAVGAYHSRTPRHAKRYTALYKQHLAQVRTQPPVKLAHRPAKRASRSGKNQFPLLTSQGASVSSGSLVLLSQNGQERKSLITHVARAIFP